MGIDIQKFVGGVIGAIVAVIVIVAVAIPVIGANQVADTVTNYAAMNSMINIIPLLLIVSVILGVIGMFLMRKKNE